MKSLYAADLHPVHEKLTALADVALMKMLPTIINLASQLLWRSINGIASEA